MELPLVSIIIPIYNAELTLKRCVDSVLSQSYEQLEVILVDDGSQDTSYQICCEYEKQDSRIKIIHKAQSGVSDSRNKAMDLAKGTYLQFVDSDDWLASHATEFMVETAIKTKCDMVITHFYRVNKDKIRAKGHIKHIEIMNRNQFAEHMMEKPANFYYGVMWNKLYRRDIMEEHHIRCETGINWCEDFLFNLQYLCCVDKIAAIPFPSYYYVKTKNSLVSREATVKKTIQMKLATFSYYKALYEEMDLYDENKAKVTRYLVSMAEDGM